MRDVSVMCPQNWNQKGNHLRCCFKIPRRAVEADSYSDVIMMAMVIFLVIMVIINMFDIFVE